MISILTPAFNAASTLEECIRGVAALHRNGPLEQIVIDDGSTDDTARVAETLAGSFPFVRLLRKAQGGEASALNHGLREARGDFLAIVEADVIPAPDWLVQLLPHFQDPTVMGAGGFLTPYLHSSWISRLAGYEIEEKMAAKPLFTRHITSANALYRREIFRQLGFFREDLVNASLDAEFNERVCRAGFRLRFDPSALASHRCKDTFLEFLARQFAYARFRRHLPQAELYPQDRWTILGFLCTTLIVTMAPLPRFRRWIPFLVAGNFLSSLPLMAGMIRRRPDPALFLFPAIWFLRSFVHLGGMGAGILDALRDRLFPPSHQKEP